LILRYANPLSPKEVMELCESINNNDIHSMQGQMRIFIEFLMKIF